MGRQETPAVLDLHVALERGLEQVPERRGDRDHEAENDRFPDRQVVLLVEGDEGDEHGRRGSEQEALPRLPRRQRRRQLVAADQTTGEERSDVAAPDGQKHGEGGELTVVMNPPEQEQMGEAEPDPGGAEHGRGDRDRRGLPSLGDPVE